MVSRSKKIFGLIKKELPGVELCKDMLVIVPTEHIVRGFLIETTIEKGRVYFWRVVMPLHRPMKHMILDYSDRIFPESGKDLYIDKNANKDSSDRIRALIDEHLDYLRSIRGPHDFLRHVDWMMGSDSIRFRYDLALTYFRIGKVHECREILEALVVDIDQQDREYREMYGAKYYKYRSKNPVDDEIKLAAREVRRNPKGFATLLDQWENNNIEAFGLQASRPPSTVSTPAE